MRAVIVLFALTAVAHAEPPGLTAPVDVRPAPPEIIYQDSYRAQVLASDGVAIGLVLLAAMNSGNGGHSSNTTSLLELSVATYIVGAPLIHLLHDRGTHALASIGLRVAVPFVFAFVASKLQSDPCGDYSNQDYCDSSDEGFHAAIGAFVGVIAASVLDAVFLADRDARPSTTRMTATPLTGGGVALGLAGRF